MSEAKSKSTSTETSKSKSAMAAEVSPARLRRNRTTPSQPIFTARVIDQEKPQRQAELFYLQKQIQAKTAMVIVLEDGEKVEGVIEWYDRHALKVRGKSRTLVYKHAIKYMYKVGE